MYLFDLESTANHWLVLNCFDMVEIDGSGFAILFLCFVWKKSPLKA